MATTSMLTSNALTQKLWAKQDWNDIIKDGPFGRAFRNGSLYYAPELNGTRPGDEITFQFTGLVTGPGINEGGTLVGNENALRLDSATMSLGLIRKGINNPNDDTIEQQRTSINFEDTARSDIKEWYAALFNASFLNQAAGNTATSITHQGATFTGANLTQVLGKNAAIAPSANRIIRAGDVANDQSLTSSDTITLDMIDYALELAQRTYPTIRPLKVGGKDMYDLHISWEQFTDLQHDGTGKIQYYANALAMMQGGKIEDNPLLRGADGGMVAGQYKNVNIIPSAYVSYGVDSGTSAEIATVRRAVLVGQKAVAFGSVLGGRPTDKNVPFIYKTELQDYEYYKGIEGRAITAMKKLQFNDTNDVKQDFGSIVLSTYAAPHV